MIAGFGQAYLPVEVLRSGEVIFIIFSSWLFCFRVVFLFFSLALVVFFLTFTHSFFSKDLDVSFFFLH